MMGIAFVFTMQPSQKTHLKASSQQYTCHKTGKSSHDRMHYNRNKRAERVNNAITIIDNNVAIATAFNITIIAIFLFFVFTLPKHGNMCKPGHTAQATKCALGHGDSGGTVRCVSDDVGNGDV
jgi:hypothetical protein